MAGKRSVRHRIYRGWAELLDHCAMRAAFRLSIVPGWDRRQKARVVRRLRRIGLYWGYMVDREQLQDEVALAVRAW